MWSSARKIGLTATGLAVLVPLLVPTFTAPVRRRRAAAAATVTLENPIVDMRRDLFQGEDIEPGAGDHPDPTRAICGSASSTSSTARRGDPRARHPGRAACQRAGAAAARPRWTVRAEGRRATVEISDELRLPVAAGAVPGRLGRGARATGATTARTLDFYSAVKDQIAAGHALRAQRGRPRAADERARRGRPRPRRSSAPTPSSPRRPRHRAHSSPARSPRARTASTSRPSRCRSGSARTAASSTPSTGPTGNGTEDLVQFLGTGDGGRIGYCEQFAASMAVMARSLGIPARVAVGFLRPETSPGRLRLQLPRHARVAGAVLRGHRLGALRADPAGAPAASRPTPPGSVPRGQPTSSSRRPPAPSPDPDRPPAACRRGQQRRRLGARLVTSSSARALVLRSCVVLAPRTARAWLRRRRWAAADHPGRAGRGCLGRDARHRARPRGRLVGPVTLRTRALELVRSSVGPGDEDTIGAGGEPRARGQP